VTEHPAYRALALQLACPQVRPDHDRPTTRAMMAATLAKIEATVPPLKAMLGEDIRLLVLPEYFLTGFPMGATIAQWADKASLEIDGPEYTQLAQIAEANALFLAGNVYERDPHFPGLYFQSCFIIAPNGETVLRYRRLVSMFAPSPYDVWDAYIDIYGEDAIFPVANTAIGRLAGVASEEILYPELIRCFALKGAEIFCHSSSETSVPGLSGKDIAKRARAVENLAYVVSANSGSMPGAPTLDATADGMSKIVDFTGLVIAEAATGESAAALAELDLGALKRYRRRPGMTNILSRLPNQLYAPIYERSLVHRKNTMLEGGKVVVPERAYFKQRQLDTIQRLSDEGII
jgi:predicted amidohydrolase